MPDCREQTVSSATISLVYNHNAGLGKRNFQNLSLGRGKPTGLGIGIGSATGSGTGEAPTKHAHRRPAAAVAYLIVLVSGRESPSSMRASSMRASSRGWTWRERGHVPKMLGIVDVLYAYMEDDGCDRPGQRALVAHCRVRTTMRTSWRVWRPPEIEFFFFFSFMISSGLHNGMYSISSSSATLLDNVTTAVPLYSRVSCP
jgi:hypothetical protein